MIRIYHNPRCTKSRQTLELLRSKGIEPQVILYLEQGLTKTEIKEILAKLKLSPREIMRKNEDEFREQNLADKNLSDEDLIAAIAKNPKLLERPIVINDNKAGICRPPENILSII